MHFAKERATISVNVRNMFDDRIQQHVWGDIISRKIIGQVVYRL